MTLDPSQLLRQLEPAVRPVFGPGSVAPTRPGLADQSFQQLLTLASQGAIESGRQVQLAFEPIQTLDDEQIARLSTAADRAEASGAKRAMMLIDGRGFLLDVEQRALIAELSGGADSRYANGLDAAVYVPSPDDQETEPLRPPVAQMPPAGVAQQIADARSAPPPNTGRA